MGFGKIAVIDWDVHHGDGTQPGLDYSEMASYRRCAGRRRDLARAQPSATLGFGRAA